MTVRSCTAKYADCFAALSPDSLPELAALLSDQVHFSDPFNDLYGKDSFIAVFRHMFAVTDGAGFAIHDIACSQRAGYIKWQMGGRLRRWPRTVIDLVGLSEITFDKQGKVVSHHDHWDSAHQLLVHLPLAGSLVKLLLLQLRLPESRPSAQLVKGDD